MACQLKEATAHLLSNGSKPVAAQVVAIIADTDTGILGKIAKVNQGKTAEKHTPKELLKVMASNKYLGFGSNGSSTARYATEYGQDANTAPYKKSDAIWVSSNGKRGGRVSPVSPDGKKLINGFEALEQAMEVGATIVMDTDKHITYTSNYNIGEVALASYMTDNGYERDSTTGAGIWTKKATKPATKPKKAATVEGSVKEPTIKWLNANTNVIVTPDGATQVTVTSVAELVQLGKDFNALMADRGLAPKEIDAHIKWFEDLFGDLDNDVFSGKDITVKFEKDLKVNGKSIPGQATGETKIQMSAADVYGTANPIKVLLHEFAHNLTIEQLAKSPAAKSRVRAIMNKAVKAGVNKNVNTAYAFTNEAEFVAEVISNPALQNALKDVVADGKSTLLDKVRAVFKNLLRRAKADGSLDNALGDTLDIIIGLQNGNFETEVSSASSTLTPEVDVPSVKAAEDKLAKLEQDYKDFRKNFKKDFDSVMELRDDPKFMAGREAIREAIVDAEFEVDKAYAANAPALSVATAALVAETYPEALSCGGGACYAVAGHVERILNASGYKVTKVSTTARQFLEDGTTAVGSHQIATFKIGDQMYVADIQQSDYMIYDKKTGGIRINPDVDTANLAPVIYPIEEAVERLGQVIYPEDSKKLPGETLLAYHKRTKEGNAEAEVIAAAKFIEYVNSIREGTTKPRPKNRKFTMTDNAGNDITGTPVELPFGYEGMATDTGNGWIISEVSTGYSLGVNAGTKKDAIAQALDIITKLGEKKFTASVDKALESRPEQTASYEPGAQITLESKSKSLLVPASAPESANNPATTAEGFTPKSEYHLTALGFPQGKQLQEIFAEKPGMEAELQKLIDDADFGYTPTGKLYNISRDREAFIDWKDKSKGKEMLHEEAIIELVEAPGIAEFIGKANKLLDTDFPIPFPHISLAVKGTKFGIGIANAKMFSELNPTPIDGEMTGAYMSPLDSVTNPAIITDNIESPTAAKLGVDMNSMIAAEVAKATNKLRNCK